VLLANPRWKRRFVRFLELSGVGRTMADGTDEEAAHAARMDEWIVWETRRGRWISYVVADRPRAGSWPLFFVSVALPHIP